MVALVRRQVSRHNISQFQEIFEIGGLMEKFIGTKYSGKFAVRWVVGRTNNYNVNVGTGRMHAQLAQEVLRICAAINPFQLVV